MEYLSTNTLQRDDSELIMRWRDPFSIPVRITSNPQGMSEYARYGFHLLTQSKTANPNRRDKNASLSRQFYRVLMGACSDLAFLWSRYRLGVRLSFSQRLLPKLISRKSHLFFLC